MKDKAERTTHKTNVYKGGGSQETPAFPVLLKLECSEDMTCEGGSNAVTWVLNNPEELSDTDLTNKVCINSEHSMDTLLEMRGKAGKALSYVGPKEVDTHQGGQLSQISMSGKKDPF
ncbi:hypothetical protein MC885_011540 [Smutsia gigantea]|nr:hypothetical protein MC885_011540 [Smutsia gigantea]